MQIPADAAAIMHTKTFHTKKLLGGNPWKLPIETEDVRPLKIRNWLVEPPGNNILVRNVAV